MVITPVCPHLLSLRPIVIPLSASVSIRIHGPGDRALVSPDGRAVGMSLGDGDGVTVCRASRNRLVVSLPDEEGYYVRLGRKLGWSFRG
jgi:NAD+ kinase